MKELIYSVCLLLCAALPSACAASQEDPIEMVLPLEERSEEELTANPEEEEIEAHEQVTKEGSGSFSLGESVVLYEFAFRPTGIPLEFPRKVMGASLQEIGVYSMYEWYELEITLTKDGVSQVFEHPMADMFWLTPATGKVWISDVNFDGNSEFLIDLGPDTSGRMMSTICYSYDEDSAQFRKVEGFEEIIWAESSFYPEEECFVTNHRICAQQWICTKYIVDGDKVIKIAELIYEDVPTSEALVYSEYNIINGEREVVHFRVPKEEIEDIKSWHISFLE